MVWPIMVAEELTDAMLGLVRGEVNEGSRLWRDTKIACKDISLTGGRGSNTLEGAYCSSGSDDWR